jgi:hypothetical protein
MLMIQQVHDLAELMTEAWQERLAICTADGIPLAEAEQTALKQLRAMLTHRGIGKDPGYSA